MWTVLRIERLWISFEAVFILRMIHSVCDEIYGDGNFYYGIAKSEYAFRFNGDCVMYVLVVFEERSWIDELPAHFHSKYYAESNE